VAAHVRAFTFILVELCELQWTVTASSSHQLQRLPLQQQQQDTPGYTGSPRSPEQQQRQQRSVSVSYTKIVNVLVDRLRLDPLRVSEREPSIFFSSSLQIPDYFSARSSSHLPFIHTISPSSPSCRHAFALDAGSSFFTTYLSLST
jgi:hypothetical protein